ncbi:hypothetical protein [Anaerostipes faecis]|uniref:hypothetical protein n=1 Tax=Anaerostipes faecis TaxID=2880702 RepID=UPI00265A9D40|nr:hypothetical protein [Anaerostipes faecis]
MNTNNFTSETSIYIIDDHYRIVHFNRELQQVFPKICCGDICYEVFAGKKRRAAAVLFMHKRTKARSFII